MSDETEERGTFLNRLTAVLDLMSWKAGERERGRKYAAGHTTDYAGDPNWDEYFHAIAQVVALKSKDRNRKVGAVVVGEGRVILSTGFNGLPRGVRDVPERMAPQSEKYRWITHAETNAIFNAARAGISLVGGTLYVTTFPCGPCAQAIVQSGIQAIFTYGSYWENDPNGFYKAVDVLAEAGVGINAPLVRKKDASLWNAEAARKRNADAPLQTADKVSIPGKTENDGRQVLRTKRAPVKALRQPAARTAKRRAR